MSKQIHTIQSSDKKQFDEQVNEFLELGYELMEGGYEVINNDDGDQTVQRVLTLPAGTFGSIFLKWKVLLP